MLETGNGITVDYENAAKYYKMAADLNNEDGMYNYGLLLETGKGVKRDKKEAARYYEMAAAKGHDKAKQRSADLKASVCCNIF
ncbi:hypothetical protein M9Y10_019029 [Tritrichomonas musculus]|uniref:Uncharacterized protein n=1 Tax=Tritrichomonas musculus TaxID=1915356 RepID=A0ABR2HJB8_9EUKA